MIILSGVAHCVYDQVLVVVILIILRIPRISSRLLIMIQLKLQVKHYHPESEQPMGGVLWGGADCTVLLLFIVSYLNGVYTP